MRAGNKPLSELASSKARQESPGVTGLAQLQVPPVCFPFGRGLPRGAAANERGSQRWEMLGSIKGSIESCTVSTTHSGAAKWIKLLSSLHTLKVLLLADRPDSLGVKEKTF